MAPSRAERYASAEMLASDLDAYLDNRPLPWRSYDRFTLLRLLCKRSPLLVGASAVAAVLFVAVVYLVYLRETANLRESEHKASIKIAALDARIAKEAAREQERKKIVDLALRSMERMSAAGLGTEWLPVLSAMEALTGSVLMGDPTDAASLWAKRIRIAEDLVRTAEAEGRGQDLEPLVWQSALTVWLVRAGRPDDAVATLERNRAAWARRLEPGDRWLARLDLVRVTADAAAAAHAFREGRGSQDAAKQALEKLARTFDSDTGIDDRDPAARLRLAVLRDGRAAGLIFGSF
jgi:hypothetical protein